jgi:hypothetical protein
VGTVLLALPTSGQLTVFVPAESFKQIARYKVADEGTYAYPVAAGNRIYIKDFDSVTLWTVEWSLTETAECHFANRFGSSRRVVVAICPAPWRRRTDSLRVASGQALAIRSLSRILYALGIVECCDEALSL